MRKYLAKKKAVEAKMKVDLKPDTPKAPVVEVPVGEAPAVTTPAVETAPAGEPVPEVTVAEVKPVDVTVIKCKECPHEASGPNLKSVKAAAHAHAKKYGHKS